MIFDCHLDLAMNAVHWNRDLTKSLAEIRQREAGLKDKLDRGNGVVNFEEMRTAGIRICIATQLGHSVSQKSPLQGWNSPEIAWAQTQAQLAWYREMEKQGELTQIRSREDLIQFQSVPSDHPAIGFILSLEGADSLVNLDYLHRAYNDGLRLVGPAHYGPGRYAAGTGEDGGFTPLGRALLKEMSSLNLILDVTHLTDRGFEEALDQYEGPIIASHHNCRIFVDHQRQLSDDQIRKLVDRESIIGVALDAWMLVPGWVRGKTTPASSGVSLEDVVNNIDHVCQIAGSADHSVLGSDLDGAFGNEQTPIEITSMGKLSGLGAALTKRNYEQTTIGKILFKNAYSFFEKHLTSETFEPVEQCS
ncbi:MAG: membrane dipeptidase [Planctomycetota bacterium]|nr:membrane dipeptidase [Planctomycetota bacterium]